MSPALETLLLPFAAGRLAAPAAALFLGAEPHPALKSWPLLTGWQPHKPLAEAWRRAGHELTEQPHGRWPLILLLPGKSKEETLFLFSRAYDLLNDDGLLVVSMPNTAGAGRFEKELGAVAGGLETASKNKCRVFYVAKSVGWNAIALEEWRALGQPRRVGEFTTQAGIFSPDHVDPGSAYLIENLPQHLKGIAADLGSGWGYLAKSLAAAAPGLKAIHLFEADARALDCSRANLAECPVEIFFHWHDVTSGLPGRYDLIVMNAPFHAGQQVDISLGIAFLRAATESLRLGGRLFMVANRQLPYEGELDRLGLTWRKAAENAAYKLLFAERRR